MKTSEASPMNRLLEAAAPAARSAGKIQDECGRQLMAELSKLQIPWGGKPAAAGQAGGSLAGELGAAGKALAQTLTQVQGAGPTQEVTSPAPAQPSQDAQAAQPAATAEAVAPGGDAAGGSPMQTGMANLQAKDPTLFSKVMKDAKSGDGNQLVKDLLQAYKQGAISKDECKALVANAQKTANENGGGKINGKVRNEAKDVLGEDVVKGGKTRGQVGAEKFFTSFGIGALVDGTKKKLEGDNKPEGILSVGEPLAKGNAAQAMENLKQSNPELAAQFQKQAKAGDGNGMVDTLTQAKRQQGAGGAFTDQDAQALGVFVGDAGKGKVNGQKADAFAKEFGADTLDRGSSKGAKGWNKFQDGLRSVADGFAAPFTGMVGFGKGLAEGDVKGALKNLGEAALGVASLVPVVGPLARGGMAAAKAGATFGGKQVLGDEVANKGKEWLQGQSGADILKDGGGDTQPA